MTLRKRHLAFTLLALLPLAAQDVPRAIPADTIPSDKGSALFELANLAYSQKDYNLAEKNYSAYILTFPTGSHADEALFQKAQCALIRDDETTARDTLETLMNLKRTGRVSSGGAFLLAVIEYKAQQWPEAAAHFDIARTGLDDPPRKIEATYFLARALQNSEQHDKAATFFTTLAQSEEDSPYVVDALRQVANNRLAAGDNPAALRAFTNLINRTDDPQDKAEYLVKSGLIQLDQGSPETAAKSFVNVLSLPNSPPNWRSYALSSLLQIEWRNSAWDNVLNLAEAQKDLINQEPRYETSLILGDANRMTKKYAPAARAYQTAEELAPDQPQALEAGYFRLLCLYQAHDDDLPNAAQTYFNTFSKTAPNSPDPHKGLRLAGDFLYLKKDYHAATQIYQTIDLLKLPADLRVGLLLRLGWSQWESGAREPAEATFTQFLEAYPDHPETPTALTRRGISRMDRKDYPNALADMQHVITHFPNSPYTQQAMHATAVILGQLKQWQKLTAAYHALHKQFPETQTSGEGYYWIGRAHIELQQPKEAVSYLKAAIQTNPKLYTNDAGQLILYSFYTRKDYAALGAHIDEFQTKHPELIAPPRLCWWTGQQNFIIKNFPAASKYLLLGNTNAAPTKEPIPYPIWDMLEISLFHQGAFSQALAATEQMLIAPESQPKEKGALKADLLRRKALAQLSLAHYEEARTTTQQGLEIIKEGETNARLILTLGDIDLARGRALVAENKNTEAIPIIQEAVKRYTVVSQTIKHPDITPEALYKASGSLRFLKEDARADVLLQQLNRDYPHYKP